jgi:hypothetical protein
MISDDAAIGAVVTGTQEKVVSTVATKSILHFFKKKKIGFFYGAQKK